MSFSLQPLNALAGDFLQATFRGVPFAVMGSMGTVGRRVVTHDYPGHDGVWSEDLGRKGRVWTISGLLVGPQCYTNRDLLQLVVEKEGAGLLIHPSLGILNVCCVHFDYRERSGYTNVIDLTLSFVEQKELLSTLVTTGLHALIAGASMALGGVTASGYVGAVSTLFNHGPTVSSSACHVAQQWGNRVTQHALRPQAIAQVSRQIKGNHGRYWGYSGAASTADALGQLADYRHSVQNATAHLGNASTPAALCSAVSAVATAYTQTITDTNTRLSLLLPFATVPENVLSPLPQQAAILSEAEKAVRPWTEFLCTLALIGSLAQALSEWEPASSPEARSMIERIGTLFDDLQTAAGNNNLDALYQALATLAAHTLAELNQKATILPDTVTVSRAQPLPALTLAQQLYADGKRADELTNRTNTPHPAFMPLTFEAKSS